MSGAMHSAGKAVGRLTRWAANMSDTIKGALIIAAAIVWAGESMRFRPGPEGPLTTVVDGRTGEVRICSGFGCGKRLPAPETDTFSPYVPADKK